MAQDYQDQPAPPALSRDVVQSWISPNSLAQADRHRYIANRATAWTWEQAMTTLATREQAAADAELMAANDWLRCLEKGPITGIRAELTSFQLDWLARELRAARRPKPPTLAEQAMAAQQRMWAGSSTHDDWHILRTALRRLQELEQATTTTETAND